MTKKTISFLVLIISDISAILLCFFFAYLIRSEILPYIYHGFQKKPIPLSAHLDYFYMVIIWILIFAYEKLYTKRFTFWDEAKVLLKSTTIAFFLIMSITFIARKSLQFSRAIIILAWLISLILFPIFRSLIKKILIKLNLWKKKIIILGAAKTGKLILEGIRDNKIMGYEIAGFLDDDPQKIGKKIKNTEVLGKTSELEELSTKLGFQDVIIAMPSIQKEKLIKILERCEKVAETIRIVPDTVGLITVGVEIENLGEALTLSIRQNLTKPWNIFIKNFFEFLLTLIITILLLPILLIIALAIKIDSRGSIIFTQERLGKGNKTFKFYKFRSMYKDEDLKLNEYLEKNPATKKEWNKYQKLKSFDPRVTRVGKFLRKYSLDELPQLFNVLKGEMSLVGPRPYLLREMKIIGQRHRMISKVKPGITGLWQVSGRNILPFKERLSLDEYYIRNWSLWLDIVILLKTIKALAKREGAY
ncbi:MAG: undecaprenyl-phosphate galactose phosphotransferase WbaP [Candidatus Aminicenantia bacterium]